MELKDPKLFRQQCYVNGEWVDALNRGTIPVTNPATGETLGTVPRMGAEETRQAIEAADRALPAWRARTAKERAQILRKLYDLMMANQEDLATLMTAEQGKPLAESKGEIAYAAAFIEWFGEEGKRIYGDTIPAHGTDKRIVVIKEPIGVCAAITPWNFPAAMITRKCGPALAAGCTMVLKPATATPFSALALCELAERAGVPKGVFSCVTGPSNEVGGETRVRNQFLKEMDGIQDKGNNVHLYTVGATNKPWALDWPFLRRFEKRIYIPLPNFEGRMSMFKSYTVPINVDTGVSLEDLSRISDGYSGSDIRDICQGGQMRVVRELFETGKALDKSVQPRPIVMSDFKETMKSRNG